LCRAINFLNRLEGGDEGTVLLSPFLWDEGTVLLSPFLLTKTKEYSTIKTGDNYAKTSKKKEQQWYISYNAARD
jgi:hypothetical protein